MSSTLRSRREKYLLVLLARTGIALLLLFVIAEGGLAQVSAPKSGARADKPAASGSATGKVVPPTTAPSKTKAATAAKAAPASAERSSADQAAREQLLRSEGWRQTMQRFDQWLAVQEFYDPQQVKQLKARLQIGIGRMSAEQLQRFQSDLRAKLDVLTSEQASDASSYLTQTLQVASPAYARKLRQKLPDVLTSSADEIGHQFAALAAKHRTAVRVQDRFVDNKRQVVSFNDWRLHEARRKERERAQERADEINTPPRNYRPASEYYPLADSDEISGISTWSGWGSGFF